MLSKERINGSTIVHVTFLLITFVLINWVYTSSFELFDSYYGYAMPSTRGLRRLELVDMLGQTLRAETLMGNAAQVDLGNCSAGIYMLRIYTDNGIINKQWIKR